MKDENLCYFCKKKDFSNNLTCNHLICSDCLKEKDCYQEIIGKKYIICENDFLLCYFFINKIKNNIKNKKKKT